MLQKQRICNIFGGRRKVWSIGAERRIIGAGILLLYGGWGYYSGAPRRPREAESKIKRRTGPLLTTRALLLVTTTALWVTTTLGQLSGRKKLSPPLGAESSLC